MKATSHKSALILGASFAAAAVWVYRDYHSWLNLGEGGFPPTFYGWLQTTRVRFKMRNPFDLTDVRRLQGTGSDIATLTLPPRASARPYIDPHPVPHRQMTERPNEKNRKALQEVFDEAVVTNSPKVRWAKSHFEKHIPAITCGEPTFRDPVGGSSRGEIAHIHIIDGSTHMVLSPSDTIVAIESGWAEFHGLAGLDHGLPLTYVMVYGPQTDQEVAVLGRMLQASIDYMTQTAPAAS